MERVRFVEHRGVRILLADFSGLQGPEALHRELERARKLVQQQPPESLLILVNLEGVPYTLESVGLLRKFALLNRPYVKARAVIGLAEVARLSFRAVAYVSGRKMEAFDDEEVARSWLISQL